jgi:predicted ribosomally synthesized peptide with SipW-like signal peptide
MSKKPIELSRRKILGGIGAAGVASVGAGLGTSAYFSDTESFEGNTLTAGELDLKVDWEEHYNYPQIYGFGDPAEGLDVTRSEPNEPDNYTALPDPQNPMVWVHNDDLDSYMDNTAIEAFPDVDGDGVQDSFSSGEVEDFCTDGADTPEDMDPTEGLRTENDDTYDDSADDPVEPLVSLTDVKPGDFGELTLSYHLCDNPGYVWVNGGLVEAAENDWTEPEASAADETGNSDDVVTSLDDPVADDIELLNSIQTAWWYDGDCDNVLDAGGDEGEGEEADVIIVMDISGSMDGNPLTQAKSGANTLIDALGPNDQVGLVSFASGVTLDQGLTTDHNAVQTAVNNLNASGSTNMEAGVEQAHEELFNDDEFGSAYTQTGNARPNARKIIVFLGDGGANTGTNVTDSNNTSPVQESDNVKSDGAEMFTIAYGSGAPSGVLGNMASDPSLPENPEDQYAYDADVSDIEETFEEIGGGVGSGGEEVIFRGTLRESLEQLEDGDGIPLDGDLSTEDRACYQASQTNCIGFSWWVPTEVENEIQTDSVSFDVGFYTEQCRHNDGNGDDGDNGTSTSTTTNAAT